MRIGLLTGGGDAPGLNGVIESASKTLLKSGHEVIGIHDGFEGVYEHRFTEITRRFVEGAHAKAGTLLGTSNRCGTEGREEEFLKCFKKLKLDGLIAAGGDGTFRGLQAFKDDIKLIGVPKTIDNDLHGTDVTFGFDTACSVVANAVDALRYSAHAHKRILLVETMGRTAGWIALVGGMASYADAILLPEIPYDPKEFVKFLKDKLASKQRGIVCVVSEGAHAIGEDVHVSRIVEGAPEKKRLGGVSESIARMVEKETGVEARNTVLGYLQRSEHPTPTDRMLTLSLGVEVGMMVDEGDWGRAAVYKNGTVARTEISELMKPPRLVPLNHPWLEKCRSVGIFV